MNQHLLQNNAETEFALLIAAFVLILLTCFILVFIVMYQKKRRDYVNDMDAIKREFKQTLLQTQLEIQEQTLQHISREIHDNLSHTASLIKIHLNTIKWNHIEEAMSKVDSTKDLTRQLIADLKTLSVNLNSDRIAQSGLANALAAEAEKINKTGAFEASFILEGDSPTIENDKAIILYRMVQEVLNNMLKHSQAKHIRILLHTSENFITLAVSDDGVGFDLDEKMKSGGAGLLNLQNRARLINAKLNMQSTPGNGSAVSIELPF